MRTFTLLLLAGLVAISSHSQAFADGFRYAGSPKLGSYYVKGDDRCPSALIFDARAQLSRAASVQLRGGIALRAP